MQKFTGNITQLPPKRSAVKRQPRKREVYYLEILEINSKDFLFKVGCEAGFYVRKLAHDFGKEIGTGAHLTQLVRTKVGFFNDRNWATLHDLKDAYEFYKNGNELYLRKIILPFETAVYHLPKVWVLDSSVDPLCHGSKLATPGIAKLNSLINKNEKVAIMTLKDELIGIGISLLTSKEMLNDNRNIAIKIDKTFMPCETYPRYIKRSKNQL